jgi:DNA-directed RNA polymerase alpha subunit
MSVFDIHSNLSPTEGGTNTMYGGMDAIQIHRVKYPEVSNISSSKNSALTFRLKSDMSIANAIRRTILSDIPVAVIDTNKCIIEANQCGGGQHNEYLKHRLDCIPVIVPPEKMADFVNNYYLSVDVKNDTTQIKHVTTEHFKLIRKTEGEGANMFEANEVFPPYQHKYFIEFAHLKPAVGDGDVIPGGVLRFSADFKVSTAKENAAYNAVSKCTAPYTVDETAAKEEWKKREQKMKSDGKTDAEIELHKSNFWALDSQRIYVKDSFDFEVKTLGMYSDRQIVKHACAILANKFEIAPAKFRNINSEYSIKTSTGQVSNDPDSQTYIIYLGDEDYTMGKVIEYILFEYFYFVDEPVIRFCTFKKMHPHDSYGVLQVSLSTVNGMTAEQNNERINIILEKVCKIGVKIFSHIEMKFEEGVKRDM